MITPKEKAKELFELFYFTPDEDGFHSQNKYRAKSQAILCVTEMKKMSLSSKNIEYEYAPNSFNVVNQYDYLTLVSLAINDL